MSINLNMHDVVKVNIHRGTAKKNYDEPERTDDYDIVSITIVDSDGTKSIFTLFGPHHYEDEVERHIEFTEKIDFD